MTEVKASATLIGDVVASRAHERRRAALHRHLQHAIDDVNEQLTPSVPLRVTVGDEYQGCFATVGEACHASFLLRLALLPAYDVRHGIGWGPITVLRAEPRVEDGPGWWAAREAIESIESEATKAALRGARTSYRVAAASAGPAYEAVDAALILRDQRLSDLSERSITLLQGLVAGRSQKEMAAEFAISTSALSQRVRRDGLGALIRADELLRRVR